VLAYGYVQVFLVFDDRIIIEKKKWAALVLARLTMATVEPEGHFASRKKLESSEVNESEHGRGAWNER